VGTDSDDIEGSFHASVTNWPVEVAARPGEVPEFYEPLRRWLNSELQPLNMAFALTAMTLFSWAALHTRLVPARSGWAALVWSLLSFPVYSLVLGAPLIVIVPSVLLGIGFLR
jgi:cellulose synthase/poly-beta-1,6-N-acetylglucosamine synthase-like glycosyltransferase